MKERKFKRAWRSFYRHIFFIAVCLAAVLALSANGVPDDYQDWPWLAFAAVVVCALCDMAWKRSGVLLTVKPDEIAVEQGLIARQSIEIDTRDIRTIQVNQSILQRILNLGDIRVASSGTSGYEISVRDMPGPNEIRELIQANERSAGKNAERNERY